MVRRILPGLCAFALALGVISSTSAAPNDAAVQKLDNIASLARLKTDTSVHAYVHQVASAYRKAGYKKLAAELIRAEPLFQSIAQSEDSSENLPAARRALGKLKVALKRSGFVVIPLSEGDRIPNYLSIAASFVANSSKALKNLAAGEPVGKGLNVKPDSDWVTNVDGKTVEFSSSSSVSFEASGGMSKSGSGTLSLSGANIYTGTAIIESGSLRITSVSALLAVPADVLVPADITDAPFLVFHAAYTVDGIDFPSGTQFFKVADDYVAPDGTTLLPAGPFTAMPIATP
jgi:autotransporter-associated beta strand protein